MNINVRGEIEELIAAQLAAGNYQSAEDFLEAMATVWKASQSPAGRASTLPIMQAKLDFSKLAAAQGVKPCADPRGLQGAGWPTEDSIDDFEVFLRNLRHADLASGPA